MIKSLVGESRRHLRHRNKFTMTYVVMLLLSLHWAIVLYVHSTYLGTLLSIQTVSALFILGSILSTVTLYFATRALSKYGNYRLTIALGAVELVSLLFIGLAGIPWLIALFFVIHQAVVPLLLFNLDIFVEGKIGKEEDGTGRTRGVLLVLMSAAGALAPLIAGFLVGGSQPHYGFVYIAGAIIMTPFLYLIHKHFSAFKDPRYTTMDVRALFSVSWNDKDLRYVFLAHLLLQLFFSWMVIYVPLYLATVVGFSVSTLLIIISIAIMAYVLLEYPVGRIADLYTGEKELMAIGFFILSITTVWLSFIETAEVIPWVAAMFMTRVGAALVEATTESYFFKHATDANAGIIGLFRITRPVSMVVGTFLGFLALLLIPFTYIFVPFGFLMLLGIYFSYQLTDTK